MTPTIKERLLAAARIMRERGLCQDGNYVDVMGRVCAFRAIDLAYESLNAAVKDPSYSDACVALQDAIDRSYPTRINRPSVTEWNDTMAKDAEEVARMFERAAAEVGT